MASTYHGGECCGIRHVHSYESLCKQSLKEIRADVEDTKCYFTDNYNEENCCYGEDEYGNDCLIGGISYEDASLLIELVLADFQLSHHESYDCLKELYKDGWKLVNSFINTNTSNKVYVFHLNTVDNGEIKDPLKLAEKWKRDG